MNLTSSEFLSSLEPPIWPELELFDFAHLNIVVGLFFCIAIITINVPVIFMLLNKCEATVVNLFIIIDCLLCLLHVFIILFSALQVQQGPVLCGILTTVAFFLSFLNRLIPVGIVVFRYVFVCRSHLVVSAIQRKKFGRFLVKSIISVPIVLSFFSFIYREKYLHYWRCLGR